MYPPEALPGVDPWHHAFWELSTERRYQMGPIPAGAIMAWPVDPSERGFFRDCIRAADAAYLEFLSKPEEERRSLPVLSVGALKGLGKKKKNG